MTKKTEEKVLIFFIASRPMSKIARAKKGEIKGFMEAIIDAKTNQF
jgi:hypothetical protein